MWRLQVTLVGLGFVDLGARCGFVVGENTTVMTRANLAFGAYRGRALTCVAPPNPAGGAGVARVELSLNGEPWVPAMSGTSGLLFEYEEYDDEEDEEAGSGDVTGSGDGDVTGSGEVAGSGEMFL